MPPDFPRDGLGGFWFSVMLDVCLCLRGMVTNMCGLGQGRNKIREIRFKNFFFSSFFFPLYFFFSYLMSGSWKEGRRDAKKKKEGYRIIQE